MSAEHNMINEDFVTFEVSKLLQDKGYRENCRAVYISAETGISKLVVLLFTSRKFGDLIRGRKRVPVRIPGSHAIRCAKMGPHKRKDPHRCRPKQTRMVLPPVRHGGFVSHIADGRIYRYIRESFERWNKRVINLLIRIRLCLHNFVL